MNIDKVFKDVVNQHECAKRVFKESYSFSTKQQDILHGVEMVLRKHQSEQLTDQNKMAALSKKIDKRQTVIDDLTKQLEIVKSVTELDIGNDRG